MACADPDFDLAFASITFAATGQTPITQEFEITGRAATVHFRWTVTSDGLITGVCRDETGRQGSDELAVETTGG